MKTIINYPYSQVEMLPGDILYLPIGKSTYFVGHTVIIGSDLHVKESLPVRPSGNSLTIDQFWRRHHKGDKITLLRPSVGSLAASDWATKYVKKVEIYHLGYSDINQIAKNYCSKFVAQAYYHGANISLAKHINRFISPQRLIRSQHLHRIAIFIR